MDADEAPQSAQESRGVDRVANGNLVDLLPMPSRAVRAPGQPIKVGDEFNLELAQTAETSEEGIA